jgi:hypothetical protein
VNTGYYLIYQRWQASVQVDTEVLQLSVVQRVQGRDAKGGVG